MSSLNDLLAQLPDSLSEDARIQVLSKVLNMHVDPVGPTDTATIAIAGIFGGITLLMLVYAWINVNYRPIRAKNMPLMTIMFISSVGWILGDIQMNGQVHLTGGWTNCKVWVIWFRILFCYIYSAVLLIRFYALDRVFNQGKPYHGWAYVRPFLLMMAVVLIFGLTCQLLPSEHTSRYIPKLNICEVHDVFRYTSIGLLWIPWLVVLVLIVRLRNIQSSFNEFRESVVICIIAFATLLETTLVHAIKPQYIFDKNLRLVETLVNVFITNVIIWLILSYPVAMCMFRRREYERDWLYTLRRDDRQSIYDGPNNNDHDIDAPYSRMDTDGLAKDEDDVGLPPTPTAPSNFFGGARQERGLDDATIAHLADIGLYRNPDVDIAGMDSPGSGRRLI
ncbi:hypothetical protein GQ54DRAFT_281006 [Martensiomyces pterosporus]|nr:hypothetical protein GQ54DRAFT_281006 [Martensiomyces pterosporus]